MRASAARSAVPRGLTFALALTAVLAAGRCGQSSSGAAEEAPVQRVAVGASFVAGPGEAFEVVGVYHRLVFRAVTGDSRCPVDVVCVWAGEAVVSIEVQAAADGAPAPLAVTMPGGAAASVTHGAFSIELSGLRPEPVSTAPVDPDDYRVDVRVTPVRT